MKSQLKNLLKKVDVKTVEEYWTTEATKRIKELLIELLMKKHEEYIRLTEKRSNYSNPCWAQAQADAIGYRRCLNEIKDLLED